MVFITINIDSIIKRFSKYLENIEYPKNKCFWNIKGRIKNSNSIYKFDVRNMFKINEKQIGQKFRIDTKADKMVLEIKNDWVILDLKELVKYGKKNKLKEVYLDDLLSKLEWNIILPK